MTIIKLIIPPQAVSVSGGHPVYKEVSIKAPPWGSIEVDDRLDTKPDPRITLIKPASGAKNVTTIGAIKNIILGAV